ncbi:glucuronate isomerase [Acidaminobacter sp. JC074]|uniref:glucuronate isomerase n=1 Tax=Acidaminobacter sp. JC074 TaxID=2530199 RepID=UPI001F0F147C|nr:glucuronate isomerase [Acidaminobacter sp. JC074]MCH4886922.1 glucuronate isomerase [Acidaminobacter sp. JC074]
MRKFLDKDFLLTNETGKFLYHDHAQTPIYDYHCHLSPKEIFENKHYKNMTELWLSGDHYKWRLMRSHGIQETFITGDGDDYMKFYHFASVLETAIGNPMYHWCHLELQRYFGIYDTISRKTAPAIWKACNEKLKEDDFRPRGLIVKSNVKVICTTDDPLDDLIYHRKLKDVFDVKVLPTFRPDKGNYIERDTFLPWIDDLSKSLGSPVESFDQLLDALKVRIEYFHKLGCRLADHGLDTVSYRSDYTLDQADIIFRKKLNGQNLTDEDITIYKSAFFHELGKMYHKLDWTLQIHIGALRNNNKRMLKLIGPDTGFDSISDETFAGQLSNMLSDLDEHNLLPRVILYVLNPRDNYVIGTMIGNFQGQDIRGKIQFGSGWWFNDQKDGMTMQLSALANLGLLGNFVGMLTDSRSFLSYTRHEYFRRILCNLIGCWVENGEFPNDRKLLGSIVENICYNNANDYFKL